MNDGLIYQVDSPAYWAGLWRGEEVDGTGRRPGTIYVNTRPGAGNWNMDGTVDRRQLRKTVIEEGVHAWFDEDVSHYADAEHDAAREKMVTACGKYE